MNWEKRIVIVGNPNVGKSVLFNLLTGSRAAVSNYPGTTVEIMKGQAVLDGTTATVIDTPGMYSLVPITEEERIARKILMNETPSLVIHVVDAKNIERMLPMTLQLIEFGFPVLLDVNMADEARRIGFSIDTQTLQQRLGIPVVVTALTRKEGFEHLKRICTPMLMGETPHLESRRSREVVPYDRELSALISGIANLLSCDSYGISRQGVAQLLLQKDEEIVELVVEKERAAASIVDAVKSATKKHSIPLGFVLARSRRETAMRMLDSAVHFNKHDVSHASRLFDAFTINPVFAFPFLGVVLFLFYQFVGVFGAQILVEFLEEKVFGTYINPAFDGFLKTYVPWPILRDLLGNEYGIVTLGCRYAFSLILPIVGTFFIAFSIIEDTGYLPRLAMLIDRIFKWFGLSGRAVIPMVLGFGCGTMATVVTRTLETKRERILSTLLLALAIPCSAQLGVVLGLFEAQLLALWLWLGVIAGILVAIGYIGSKLLPGKTSSFYMELPPLRLPQPGNVLVKTYTRMEWYFMEVLPMFILASVFIWLGQLTGIFKVVIGMLEPIMRIIGLPDNAAVAFLFGFFRRDYGAAGLYDLRHTMSGNQLLIAATTLTLFVPCVAQLLVMLKERGWKVSMAIAAFIFPFAFLVGGILNWVMAAAKIRL